MDLLGMQAAASGGFAVDERLRRTGCLPHPLVGHIEPFCGELWLGRSGCDYGIRDADDMMFEVVDAAGRVLAGPVALGTAWSVVLQHVRSPNHATIIALRAALLRFHGGRGSDADIEDAALAVPGVLSVAVHTDGERRCVLAELSGRRGCQIWLATASRPAPVSAPTSTRTQEIV